MCFIKDKKEIDGEFFYYLKGKHGVMQFRYCIDRDSKKIPVDFGLHSYTYVDTLDKYERFVDYSVMLIENCPFLEGQECCYYSFCFGIDKLLELLETQGDEAVWKELEDYYNNIFGELIREDNKNEVI